MTMQQLRHSLMHTMHASVSLMLGMLVLAATACDSLVYDDEGDCTVHYRVSFRYTKNMLNGDVFASQVTRVHLYVFDTEGRLVTRQTADRTPTTDNRFFMEVDVPAGNYDLMAWCEGTSPIANATSFSIGGGETPQSIAELTATLPLQGTAPNLYSDRDITPLFHGTVANVSFPHTYGTVDIEPVFLTKDTKHISVLLQNTDGSPIGENEYTFAIEAANHALDHRNDIISNLPFCYRPWSVQLTSATFDEDNEDGNDNKKNNEENNKENNKENNEENNKENNEDSEGRNNKDSDPNNAPDSNSEEKENNAGTTRVQTEANGVLAELTTGRLVDGRTPKLVIRNRNGEDVIRIDLIQYLLLVKGKYEGISSNQDYLDRYDNHTMMFFIKDGTWAKARIYINNWRVVPPQDIEM